MKSFVVFKIHKIKDRGTLTGLVNHDTRTVMPENAFPERTKDNYHMPPTNTAVFERFDALLPPKPRKNAVIGVEFVITASEERLKTIDHTAYLTDAAKWLTNRLGGEQNRLGYFIHRDEPNTHIHVLFIPLRDGKLSYSSYLGGSKYQLVQLQTDFAKEVGAHYGLERGLTRSGAFERSFHTYHSLVNAPIKPLPIMDPPKPSLTNRLDPEAYGREAIETYRKKLAPTYDRLTHQARLAKFQEEEIQGLKKVNHDRSLQVEQLTKEKKETIKARDVDIADLYRIIREDGPELKSLREKLLEIEKERLKQEEKNRIARERDKGWEL
jgi:hypothetical protein